MSAVNLASVWTLVQDVMIPDGLTLEGFAEEVTEYAGSYGCSVETAIRDVIDAYNEGAADEADARRNGDWDYGRE